MGQSPTGVAVHLAGFGICLPGLPVSNAQLVSERQLDTTAEWIRDNIGIDARHFAPADEAVSQLAAQAAARALAEAQVEAQAVGRILLCTTTGDWTSPAAACNVQRLLGARCPAEDKQSACASFLFGLDHGVRLVQTGVDNVLVIGADIKSRFVDWRDRRLAPIFADGAGAVLLSRGDREGGVIACELWTDGRFVQNLLTPAGGSAKPASATTVANMEHTVQMRAEGREIARHAVEAMTELGRQVCQRLDVRTDMVDLLVPHQANLRIMKDVAAGLEIPLERVVSTIARTGNTTSGTIPIALEEARRHRAWRSGALVLMVGAGAGYSGGAALYRVPEL